MSDPVVNVKAMNDLEFGDLIKQVIDRLSDERKACVRIFIPYEDWFIVNFATDTDDDHDQILRDDKGFVDLPRQVMKLDAHYR